jgi:hypothetical protein
MISLTRILEWNSIAATMLTVIIRSICAGIAAVFVAFGLCMFVGLPIALYFVSRNAHSGGQGEVGYDVVTMAHNYGAASIWIPLLVIFALGFFLGFRYFVKSLVKK